MAKRTATVCNRFLPAFDLWIHSASVTAGGFGIPQMNGSVWLLRKLLSLDTWGRLWLFVTSGPFSISAAPLAMVGAPWPVRSELSVEVAQDCCRCGSRGRRRLFPHFRSSPDSG